MIAAIVIFQLAFFQHSEMKAAKSIIVGAVFASVLAVAGCASTLFFNLRPAEKAADGLIDDVWPGMEKAGSATPASTQNELDIVMNTPAVLTLKKSMAARFGLLKPHLESVVIGLTHDGNVALRDAALINVNVLLTLDALILEENKDRATLYREIARANGRPEWESDLRAAFGKRWISRVPNEWVYRNDKGLWVKR